MLSLALASKNWKPGEAKEGKKIVLVFDVCACVCVRVCS